MNHILAHARGSEVAMADLYPVGFLSIKPLARGGVFECEVSHSDAGEDDSKWILKIPGFSWLVENVVADGHLAVQLVDPGPRQEFAVNVVRLVGNRRWYFLCDCCGQHRDRLVLDDKRLMCARCYEAKGTSARSPIRKAQLTLINETIERGGLVATRVVPDAEPYADRPSRPTIDEQEQAKVDCHSTVQAMKLGRAAGDYDIVHAALSRPAGHWENIAPQTGYTYPEKPALRETVPSLDLRVLAPSFLQYQGKMSAKTLCWGERSGRYVEVLLIADWRGDALQLMAAHDFVNEPRWQRLALVRQANGRLRFVCPVLEKNCDILYLRNGTFASREAQRLYHRSQRVVQKERMKDSKKKVDKRKNGS